MSESDYPKNDHEWDSRSESVRQRVRFPFVIIGRREFGSGHIVNGELLARGDYQ